MRINRMTLLVTDLDQARAFFTQAFGLKVIEDQVVSDNKRILLLGTNPGATCLNLALPKSNDHHLVGSQAGARVFGFFDTDNLDADLERFATHQVRVVDGPRTESFGRCVIVEDLVGNRWEFVERQR